MKRVYNVIIAAVFLGFIACFFLLRLFLPSQGFSERENRYLEQRPAFSFASLFSGEFTERFESYTTDQFPFRDSWTTLKARCEILSGKRENNDVYYCDGGVLISRYDAPAEEVILENAGYVGELASHVDVPVYFALIPSAAELERGLLPANAPTDDQSAVIETAYGASQVSNVDLLSALSEHIGEYIFYHTDHHWTSLGAYYGYYALCEAMGIEPSPLCEYDVRQVTDSFYGTAYSSSGFSWVTPDSIEVFVPDDGSAVITNYSAGDAVVTPLYDESYLAVKDKYSFFLGGNTPRLSVDTGRDGLPKLCIIRDSYTDCLLPFLLDVFSQIDLLDLRYFKSSVSEYINTGGFDMVLVLYSVPNYSTDVNLFMLGT